MQAKDVPEGVILAILGAQTGSMSGWDIAGWMGLPWKVVNAKLIKLARQKKIDGCGCGCRGDWELR